MVALEGLEDWHDTPVLFWQSIPQSPVQVVPGLHSNSGVRGGFLGLGPVAEAFLTGAAAAGVTKLTGEIAEILTLQAAHGTAAGRVGTGGGLQPVARSRRPLDPGHQWSGTQPPPGRGRVGADPADGADPVAGGLPHRRQRG